jgi:hypothetical protein
MLAAVMLVRIVPNALALFSEIFGPRLPTVLLLVGPINGFTSNVTVAGKDILEIIGTVYEPGAILSETFILMC